MKKKIAFLMVGLLTTLLAGCTKPAGESNNGSNRAAPATTNSAPSANPAASENRNSGSAAGNSSTANANGNANGSSGDPVSTVADPAKLVGSYQLNQIQKQGVATMMSQVKTELVFTADGRYSRAIGAKGKTVQTESGRFRLQGETLTFVRLLSNKTINNPPVEKNYTLALSPDGRELKLTSKSGETAIFYRGN